MANSRKPLPPPSPTRESCGTCGACCRSFAIPELNKPENVWCVHAKPGRLPGACTIYESRPQVCRTFRCLWLMSHLDPEKTPMPMAIRPDKSHVVFGAMSINGKVDENATTARVDPAYPNAWREWPMGAMIDQMVNQGITVVVYTKGQRILLERGRPPRDIGPEPV